MGVVGAAGGGGVADTGVDEVVRQNTINDYGRVVELGPYPELREHRALLGEVRTLMEQLHRLTAEFSAACFEVPQLQSHVNQLRQAGRYQEAAQGEEA